MMQVASSSRRMTKMTRHALDVKRVRHAEKQPKQTVNDFATKPKPQFTALDPTPFAHLANRGLLRHANVRFLPHENCRIPSGS